MRTPEEFDEIRPYDPEELPGVFEELIADKEFQQIVGKVLPDMPYEEACRILRSCKTSYEVQKTLFYPLLINLRNKLSDVILISPIIGISLSIRRFFPSP